MLLQREWRLPALEVSPRRCNERVDGALPADFGWPWRCSTRMLPRDSATRAMWASLCLLPPDPASRQRGSVSLPSSLVRDPAASCAAVACAAAAARARSPARRAAVCQRLDPSSVPQHSQLHLEAGAVPMRVNKLMARRGGGRGALAEEVPGVLHWCDARMQLSCADTVDGCSARTFLGRSACASPRQRSRAKGATPAVPNSTCDAAWQQRTTSAKGATRRC